MLIIIALVGCRNIQIVTLQTNSDEIYLEYNNSKYNIFQGDTSQFPLKPNLVTLYDGKSRSFEFIYYGIWGFGSTGLRSFGHIVEHDKNTNEFYEIITLSDQNFYTELMDDYIQLTFADTTEKIELTNIMEKYNSTDLKDRESFDAMIASGTYIIQHTMYLDDATNKIYVDYDVSNKSFGLYLFTFSIEYAILDEKLDMKLCNVRTLEGERLEFDVLTTNEK